MSQKSSLMKTPQCAPKALTTDNYNNHHYHESLGDVTLADIYFGRDTAIIERRKKIKKLTIQKRRLSHQQKAA